jgi:hypothetical protein
LQREEVIKKSRFSEGQMVKIQREADKSPVAQGAKQHGVGEQLIYAWRKHFGTLDGDRRDPPRRARAASAALPRTQERAVDPSLCAPGRQRAARDTATFENTLATSWRQGFGKQT